MFPAPRKDPPQKGRVRRHAGRIPRLTEKNKIYLRRERTEKPFIQPEIPLFIQAVPQDPAPPKPERFLILGKRRHRDERALRPHRSSEAVDEVGRAGPADDIFRGNIVISGQGRPKLTA